MSDGLNAQLLAALEEFEKGCSNDGHIEGEAKRPEDCPQCVRAFVNHLYSLTVSPEDVARVWLNPRLIEFINRNTH